MERQPIKHLGQPVEIAEIALMLASDSSSYLTGQTIVVDGGRLLSSM
jgi:NAD(P)-dependent dehydrogenase (short-subunit alcohol dehydrogenase family)